MMLLGCCLLFKVRVICWLVYQIPAGRKGVDPDAIVMLKSAGSFRSRIGSVDLFGFDGVIVAPLKMIQRLRVVRVGIIHIITISGHIVMMNAGTMVQL